MWTFRFYLKVVSGSAICGLLANSIMHYFFSFVLLGLCYGSVHLPEPDSRRLILNALALSSFLRQSFIMMSSVSHYCHSKPNVSLKLQADAEKQSRLKAEENIDRILLSEEQVEF